jgi:two-component system sensor histidine kinase QseC
MARHSLKRRLLTLLVASVGGAWAVAIAGNYLAAHRELDALLDAQLEQSAQLLLSQAHEEPDELVVPDPSIGKPYGHAIVYQIWIGDDVLALRSSRAPDSRLSPLDDGFSYATVGGRRFRVFGTRDESRRLLVLVGEDHAVREQIARRIALNGVLPMILVLPLLGALLWWTIARGVGPLERLGDDVARRGSRNLEPLPDADLPTEIAPLVERLNGLFARLRAALENERRFTADAAHELRTPLAALRAQAEVARGAPAADTAHTALSRVIEGCDRMSRVVEQLLQLARMEEQAWEPRQDVVDIAAHTRRVLAELAPAALEQGVTIELDTTAAPTLRGEAALLEALVRNLADNAIRHGGAGGSVSVRIGEAGDVAVVEVEDQGPGLPETERLQLGRRFFRARDTRGMGTGLGLSIVERIAEAHGGAVEYVPGQGGHGLCVVVRLPKSA